MYMPSKQHVSQSVFKKETLYGFDEIPVHWFYDHQGLRRNLVQREPVRREKGAKVTTNAQWFILPFSCASKTRVIKYFCS